MTCLIWKSYMVEICRVFILIHLYSSKTGPSILCVPWVSICLYQKMLLKEVPFNSLTYFDTSKDDRAWGSLPFFPHLPYSKQVEVLQFRDMRGKSVQYKGQTHQCQHNKRRWSPHHIKGKQRQCNCTEIADNQDRQNGNEVPRPNQLLPHQKPKLKTSANPIKPLPHG